MRVVKSDRMRQLLTARQIDLTGLGERIGLSSGAISLRNQGKVHWKWSEVCMACDILGITPNEFREIYPAGRAN